MIKVLGNNIVNAFTGGNPVKAIYAYGEKVWPSSNNNVIYYTSTDGQVVTPYKTNFGSASIISNTYSNGKGVIIFDQDLTNVGDQAFYKKNTLQTVILPPSVTTIGQAAFELCKSLINISIPEGVTYLGGICFESDSSLISITIPASCTSIGWAICDDCTSLKEVIVNSVNPPSLWKSSNEQYKQFNNNASGRLIKVPAGSVDAYKSAPGWSVYADSIVSQ